MKKNSTSKKTACIVIGGSHGGVEAVLQIISELKKDFSIPIVVVVHQMKTSESLMPDLIRTRTTLEVTEPYDKEKIKSGNIYVSPSDFHLMIEKDRTFSYSVSEPVNFSRPSIDVLFETAADAYGDQLAGVLLTGASRDGARGMKKIKDCGGITIVQLPSSAKSSVMPQSAIDLGPVDFIDNLSAIAALLNILTTS